MYSSCVKTFSTEQWSDANLFYGEFLRIIEGFEVITST